MAIRRIDQLRLQQPEADELLRDLEEQARELVVTLSTPARPRPYCWGVLVRHADGRRDCSRAEGCGHPGRHIAEAACELFVDCCDHRQGFEPAARAA